MPDTPLPNNPYARPIHATRPEGQMLVGEFYGERSGDKSLAGHGGRQVSPANRYAGVAVAVPVDMDAVAPIKTKERKRRERQPAEQTSPNTDVTSPSDSVSAEDQPPSVTEDDLFG